MIAVGSTDYEVVFYSVSGSMLKKKLAFVQLSDCALTLDFRYEYQKNECALVWGDTHGRITIVRFPDLSDPTALFANAQSTQKSKSVTSNVVIVPIQKLIDGQFPGVVCQSFSVHPGEWVRQVKFFNQSSEDSSTWQVVSCSVADHKALVFSEYQIQTKNKFDDYKRQRKLNSAEKKSGKLDSGEKGKNNNSESKNSTENDRCVKPKKRETSARSSAVKKSMNVASVSKWKNVQEKTETGTLTNPDLNSGNSAKSKLKNTKFEKLIGNLAATNKHGGYKNIVKKGNGLEIVDKIVSEFHLRKGILCFDFDTNENLIVTGSRDCDIRVWNPYVATKSGTLLKGHKSSVTHIMVNSIEHQAVSISCDKNIRVWDLKDFTCKQSIHGRNLSLGRNSITSAYLNTRSREMILGTHQLGMLEPKNIVATNNRCVVSHSRPVTAVLYNPLFDEIVTASEDAHVGVWDIRTGQKQMLFTVEKDVEITALSFDSTGRRLITGSRNGKTRVWNFNNGACLRTLASDESVEISSITCPKQYIMTAGWNKKLSAYIDSYTDDTMRDFKCRHRDDILALAYHNTENVLASSSYSAFNKFGPASKFGLFWTF